MLNSVMFLFPAADVFPMPRDGGSATNIDTMLHTWQATAVDKHECASAAVSRHATCISAAGWPHL